MGGPSAVACSYRRPHDPSSPTTNCSNKRSQTTLESASLRRPLLKTHLQSFIKPAVPTVGERPAPVQHLSRLPAGVPVNQEHKTTSRSVPGLLKFYLWRKNPTVSQSCGFSSSNTGSDNRSPLPDVNTRDNHICTRTITNTEIPACSCTYFSSAIRMTGESKHKENSPVSIIRTDSWLSLSGRWSRGKSDSTATNRKKQNLRRSYQWRLVLPWFFISQSQVS